MRMRELGLILDQNPGSVSVVPKYGNTWEGTTSLFKLLGGPAQDPFRIVFYFQVSLNI